MEYKNQHARQLAILEAASPYLAPKGQHAVALLLQANSFATLARTPQPSTDDFSLEASELNNGNRNTVSFPDNVQQMLVTIQEFLTPQEADFTRSLLNVLQAGKLMNNYRDFVQTQALTACENTASKNGKRENSTLMDFLLSQLSAEQKATFEQLQNIMYNE